MKVLITQTQQWQKLQDDLGETSFFEQGNGYQYLAIIKKTPLGKYLYLPYGPAYENKIGFKNALDSLSNLARKNRASFIRIEPVLEEATTFFNQKMKKSRDLNPKETWELNLEEDNLKDKLPSRLLRYYKNHEKNGLTIEKSHNPDDIKYLFNLQKALAKEKGISTFSENYLKTELRQPFSTLYLVKYQNPETKQSDIVAAGLVFDDETTRYNLQGAQSEQGRKLHATGILTIQLIIDAKGKKLKTFDFWGIAPEGAPDSHPWKGFTNFKKTFAGYEVKRAGTYDYILNPIKYRFYQLGRLINRVIH